MEALALNLYKQLNGEFPSQTEFRHCLAMTSTNYASFLNEMGQVQRAEEVFGEASALYLALQTEFAGKADYMQRLATTKNNLALLLEKTGRIE